ncbi:unnamed protein product [Ambrosiozyma monospora]|uniref:Unnamed protein product n=1 Tax=Ambrosiozyma monospora TaxID=43982 RepID=A0ACB5UDU2_AMBMO|nr:unnamed protein product [Ambrosiozyma monospora]
MADIQARLAYVASVNALDKAKATDGCIYLRPPIENYGTLDFGKFNQIYDVGLNYSHHKVEELLKIEGGVLDNALGKGKKKEVSRGRILRRRNSI